MKSKTGKKGGVVFKADTIDGCIAKAGLSSEILNRLITAPEAAYRVYKIPKTGGGFRTIAEPSDSLKALQKAVLPIIMSVKVSSASAAYEKGASIKKNAEIHIRARHILHIDIKDFFPSINRDMFLSTYTGSGLLSADLERLWKIVSYNQGLPIGAPTSPFIANRVLYHTDEKLKKLSLFLKYSRYADDMIFSTRRKKLLKAGLKDKAATVIERAGFKLNDKKCYFMSRRKTVTGVMIAERGKLSVGTAYKKRLKRDIYELLKNGKGFINKVSGRFEFLNFIEPAYAETLRKKYIGYDKLGFFKEEKKI